MIRLTLIAALLGGCTELPRSNDPETGKPKPSNLNVEYCRKIADETARAGKLNYHLCPGYMLDGYPVEIP